MRPAKLDPADSRLKCYHGESVPGICIEITSCPATRLVQPAFQPPPSRFSFFFLYFFSFFLHSSSRSGSSRSIFQFAVPEVERSRLAEASLLISNCRGRGIAHPRAFSLFFPVNGEERASVGSRFRSNPRNSHRPTPFAPFVLVSTSATAERGRSRTEPVSWNNGEKEPDGTRRKWWKDGTGDRTLLRTERVKRWGGKWE